MRHEEEFRGWVTANRSALRSTAYLICGDWHLADDFVQEALGRLYGSWPRLISGGNPRAYVQRTVVNLAHDYYRRASNREVPTDEFPETSQQSDLANSYAEVARLMQALRQMPPRQRAVIVLRYWDDLSIDQTAVALRTSSGNVKSQASRGLNTLRDLLTRDYDRAIPKARKGVT